MSEEKMNESRNSSPDELTKTKKDSEGQLTEEELAKASGGVIVRKAGGDPL